MIHSRSLIARLEGSERAGSLSKRYDYSTRSASNLELIVFTHCGPKGVPLVRREPECVERREVGVANLDECDVVNAGDACLDTLPVVAAAGGLLPFSCELHTVNSIRCDCDQ